MIEELKNKCVRIDGDERLGRLVVELGKLAGFGVSPDSNVSKGKFYEYIEFNADCGVVSWSSFLWDMERIVTLDQLAWDYGLAPDWAVGIFQMREGEFKWGDGKMKSQTIGSGVADNIHEHSFNNMCGDPELYVKPITKRPQKEESPVWDGKGLPPVGCEVQTDLGEFTVLTSKYDSIVVEDTKSMKLRIFPLSYVKPIPTEREKFIQAFISKCNKDEYVFHSVSTKAMNKIAELAYELNKENENV